MVRVRSLVCKSWGASVPHGLSSLELDMHPDPNRWSQRLERVAGAMRGLRSATVFINSNVSSRLLTCNLEAIKQQFASLEVRRLIPRAGKLADDVMPRGPQWCCPTTIECRSSTCAWATRTSWAATRRARWGRCRRCAR